jgi:hypothetical protein
MSQEHQRRRVIVAADHLERWEPPARRGVPRGPVAARQAAGLAHRRRRAPTPLLGKDSSTSWTRGGSATQAGSCGSGRTRSVARLRHLAKLDQHGFRPSQAIYVQWDTPPAWRCPPCPTVPLATLTCGNRWDSCGTVPHAVSHLAAATLVGAPGMLQPLPILGSGCTDAALRRFQADCGPRVDHGPALRRATWVSPQVRPQVAP